MSSTEVLSFPGGAEEKSRTPPTQALKLQRDSSIGSQHTPDEKSLSFQDLAFDEPKSRQEEYELFRVPSYGSCSILRGAMRITCDKEPMTVKARLCPLDQFDEVASRLKEHKQVRYNVFLDKVHGRSLLSKYTRTHIFR